MKLVIIIAIAVICSVSAVIGILSIGGLELAESIKTEIEISEKQQEFKDRQQETVNSYNQAIQKCKNTFDERLDKIRCRNNASNEFITYNLENEYLEQLELVMSEEEENAPYTLEEALEIQRMRLGN